MKTMKVFALGFFGCIALAITAGMLFIVGAAAAIEQRKAQTTCYRSAAKVSECPPLGRLVAFYDGIILEVRP